MKSIEKVNRPIKIRDFEILDIPECKQILYSLPDWFGIEESNRAYIESLKTLPGAVAFLDGQLVGFIALFEHNPKSIEIHVIAISESYHRKGVGKALVQWAETFCREKKVPWFQVKTRGSSTPDPQYEKTRKFYLAQGFEPLFESLTMWGPEDAALILVRYLR